MSLVLFSVTTLRGLLLPPPLPPCVHVYARVTGSVYQCVVRHYVLLVSVRDVRGL